MNDEAPRANPVPAGPTLATVLHLRIADFAAKPVVEQARVRAQLEAVVAGSLSKVRERDRIVLDASDGIAIVVLGNPVAAFLMARRCLEAATVLPMCIGAHHGAIAVVADGGKVRGIRGDGPRRAGVAARFATPAQIFTTRAFREALAAHSLSRVGELRRVGTFADDNVQSHELFVADPLERGRRRKRALIAGAICIVVSTGSVGAWRLVERIRAAMPPAPAAKAAAPTPVASSTPAASPATAAPSTGPASATTPQPAPGAAPAQARAPSPAPAAPAAAPAATPPAATTPAPAPKPKPKPAPPKPGVVTLDVTPGGDVFVDGKLKGSLPALKQLQLPPGRHQLEIRYEKQDPLQVALDVKAGQQLVVKHAFKQKKKFSDWFDFRKKQ